MGRRSKTAEHRFFEKVWYNPETGCLEWMAAKSVGYGVFSIRGYSSMAHRMAYIWANGDLPDDLDIDHLCRVRHCVNPEHLEAVTPRENILRGTGLGARNARKTECRRGHLLSGENLRINKVGGRVCIECDRAKQRRLYRASKLKEGT